MENSFVKYLNTLHNGSASNQNAIAEMQIASSEFQKTQVKRPITGFLQKKLEEGRIVVLTGHAGDGKTTILAQVLDAFGARPARLERAGTVDCGFPLHYVKDFSELKKGQQEDELSDCLRRNQAALIIANTGPLLEAFHLLTGDPRIESELLDAMDQTMGRDLTIPAGRDRPERTLFLLNIARLDNTDFIVPFLSNLTAADHWTACGSCPSAGNCPIRFNVQLLQEGGKRAGTFIENCYIWLGEHNQRATIRQITAHLAFSITGGLTCEEVRGNTRKLYRYDYLFSNLFFGSVGHRAAPGADQIAGIRAVNEAGFDRRPLSVDYDLFHRGEHTRFYGESMAAYLKAIEKNIQRASPAVQRVLRRAYLFFGRNTEEKDNRETFSHWFPEYRRLRAEGGIVPESLRRTVFRAINILFVGEEMKESGKDSYSIYLTLRRNNQQISNVQLKVGDIRKEDISFETVKISDINGAVLYQICMCTDRNQFRLSLPLLNYFQEIVDGIIVTDIDPLLSNGIDSLKAQLLAEFGNRGRRRDSGDPSEICIIYMAENEWASRNLRLGRNLRGEGR